MPSDLDDRIPASSAARAPSTEAFEDLASPSCPSTADSRFKENINLNKYEIPKLYPEPLQMKRKKKGAGYNLRKSLAWDRAFFTEEGILDPLELSAMSDASSGEGLPFGTPGGSQGGYLGKDGKKNLSSAKIHSSSCKLMKPTSQTPQRYIKPGCPRPLPSPSLKRPANVIISKDGCKESKVSKVSGAMTRSSILRANRVKHNQITQPDFSSSKSLKKAESVSHSNYLKSAQHSDGNSDISSFRRHSSISNGTVMVKKGNNFGSKIIPENVNPIRPVNLSNGEQYGSTSFPTSFSMNPLQSETIKPSGLRKPSPSFSFFSQPKSFVIRDLPMRTSETDVFESQKPGNSRLQDNLGKAPDTFSRILEITSSASHVSSHVSAIVLAKSKSEHKIDLPKEDIFERVYEEAALKNIDVEVNSEGGVRRQTKQNICKKTIGVYPVDSQSCGSEKRNAESLSKQNYAVQDSVSLAATGEPLEGKNMCNSFVLNHGSPQYTNARDESGLNTCGKTSKPDCHEPHKEKTDSPVYFLGDTDKRDDKNMNASMIKEITSEQLELYKQNLNFCNGKLSKSKNPHFRSNQLCANLPRESACIGVLSDNLTAGDAELQNPVFELAARSCKTGANIVPEICDNNKQTWKGCKNICDQVEVESEKVVNSNTGDWVVADRNEDKLIVAKMPMSVLLDRKHEINLCREKAITQPLIGTELDFVDNSLSSESCNTSINMVLNCNVNNEGNGNVLLNVTAVGNSSICSHQDAQRMEIDNCSSLSESRIHHRVMKKESACLQDDSTDDQLISTVLLQDTESDIDKIRGVWLIKSESNLLNDVCTKQLECSVSSGDEFVAENVVHSNDRMQNHTNISADTCSENSALSRTENSVSDQNEMCLSNLKRSGLSSKGSPLEHEHYNDSAKESSLEHKNCNDEYETDGCTAKSMMVPSRGGPISDTIEKEVSENTDCSFRALHPVLDHDKVEAALDPISNHQNGLNEKSLLLVLPQNAIPFSDEWLAAIEAAGEDILTRKSGAVQNSPTDKSLPEPNPWSPVKRKNNHIGPFDCTKFTAPSDSN